MIENGSSGLSRSQQQHECKRQACWQGLAEDVRLLVPVRLWVGWQIQIQLFVLCLAQYFLPEHLLKLFPLHAVIFHSFSF